MERRRTGTGLSVLVDRTTQERGSKGAFHPTYRDDDRRTRWGFFCAACGGFDVSMDPMGRIVCNSCANRRKPTEWDAAHE